MSAWFIGIDGGGTHTRAAALDEYGRELGRAEGPPALADPRDPEAAALSVAEVTRAVAGIAGRPLPCAALWAGIAGVGREDVRQTVEHAVRRLELAHHVRIGTDSQAAFYDAFGEGAGVLLVAGTGSVARGRSEGGQETRVGGWGSLLGDEGSGYWIGIESLRRVARGADGRGASTLLESSVLAELGLGDADALISWAARASKREVAALVPAVARAARAGDGVAADVLAQAAEDLTGHVTTLVAALGPWKEAPPLALSGGLLRPGGPLRDAVNRAAREQGLRLLERDPDPPRGAARLARRLTGAAAGVAR